MENIFSILQIAEEFGDDCPKWISSFAGSEYNVPDDVSNGEMVEFMVQQELLWTARLPYRDCSKLITDLYMQKLLECKIVCYILPPPQCKKDRINTYTYGSYMYLSLNIVFPQQLKLLN